MGAPPRTALPKTVRKPGAGKRTDPPVIDPKSDALDVVAQTLRDHVADGAQGTGNSPESPAGGTNPPGGGKDPGGAGNAGQEAPQGGAVQQAEKLAAAPAPAPENPQVNSGVGQLAAPVAPAPAPEKTGEAGDAVQRAPQGDAAPAPENPQVNSGAGQQNQAAGQLRAPLAPAPAPEETGAGGQDDTKKGPESPADGTNPSDGGKDTGAASDAVQRAPQGDAAPAPENPQVNSGVTPQAIPLGLDLNNPQVLAMLQAVAAATQTAHPAAAPRPVADAPVVANADVTTGARVRVKATAPAQVPQLDQRELKRLVDDMSRSAGGVRSIRATERLRVGDWEASVARARAAGVPEHVIASVAMSGAELLDVPEIEEPEQQEEAASEPEVPTAAEPVQEPAAPTAPVMLDPSAVLALLANVPGGADAVRAALAPVPANGQEPA